MQFYININQVRALEWGLNLQQAVVFAFLYELPSWAESRLIEGEQYYFACKSKIVEELPLLLDKPDTAYRIAKALEKKGLVDKCVIGNRTYFRVTNKGKSWNRKDPTPEKLSTGTPKKVGNKSDPAPKSEQGRKKIRSRVGNKSDLGSEKNPTDYINQDPINHDQNKIIQLIELSTEKLSTGDFSIVAPGGGYHFLHEGKLYWITRDMITDLQPDYPRLDDINQAIAEMAVYYHERGGQSVCPDDPYQAIDAWLRKRIALQAGSPQHPRTAL